MYTYLIKLSKPFVKRNKESILISYKEKEMEIETLEFEFDSSDQLSIKEVENLIKGTKGVCEIVGNFKQ